MIGIDWGVDPTINMTSWDITSVTDLGQLLVTNSIPFPTSSIASLL